jgi:hypothetical protein
VACDGIADARGVARGYGLTRKAPIPRLSMWPMRAERREVKLGRCRSASSRFVAGLAAGVPAGIMKTSQKPPPACANKLRESDRLR